MTVRSCMPGSEAIEGASQPIINDAGVELVAHHPAVEALRLFGDMVQVLQGDHPAGGIAG